MKKILLFISILAFAPFATHAMQMDIEPDASRIVTACTLADLSSQILENYQKTQWLSLTQEARDEKYFGLTKIIASKVSGQEKALANLTLAKTHLGGYGIKTRKDDLTLTRFYLKCAACQNDDLEIKEEAQGLLNRVQNQ